MWRSKKEALKAISRHVRTDGGVKRVQYDVYLGTDPISCKPRRMFDSDPKRLEQRIMDFYSEMGIDGGASMILSVVQAFDAKSAFAILEGAGIKESLTEIVRAYIAREMEMREAAARRVPTKTLADAYAEYLGSFDDIQDQQRKCVSSRVGPFVMSMKSDILVKDITPDMVLRYLNYNKAWSNTTWNNAMTYIKTFLRWCASPIREYAVTNPAADIKKKRVEWMEPEYMKVDQVEALARLLEENVDKRPDYLSFFVLSFFCGMRTAEIERMAEDDTAVIVTLEDETIRVAKPKGYQKGIRPRSFHIPPTALAWMKSFGFMHGVRCIDTKTRRYIGMLAKAHKIGIVPNAGRHSFITYHVAAYGEPSKTEGIVGTSASRRCENYMGLASHKDGCAYFSIMPSVSAPQD